MTLPSICKFSSFKVLYQAPSSIYTKNVDVTVSLMFLDLKIMKDSRNQAEQHTHRIPPNNMHSTQTTSISLTNFGKSAVCQVCKRDILSITAQPHVHHNILITVATNLCSCAVFNVKKLDPYYHQRSVFSLQLSFDTVCSLI